MKYLLIFLIIVSKTTQAQTGRAVEVNGTVDSGMNRPVYLIERGAATSNTNNYIILDSAIISKKGTFILKTKITEAKYLSIMGNEKGWFPFLAEPQKNYIVKGNYKELWKMSEQNSITNKYLHQLETVLRPYKKLNNQIVDSMTYYKKDSVKFNYFKKRNIQNRKLILENQIVFVKKNKANIAGLFVYNNIFSMLDAGGKIQIFKTLSSQNKKHSIAEKIKIELFEKPKTVFDYSLLNNLNNITLKDKPIIKSDFVLISFWATWCLPCIKNLPKLDSLSVSRKDIRIVSISFDQSEKFPFEYFKKNNYYWESYWDKKRSIGDIGILYSINLLPNYFLCDNAGKIILKTSDFSKVLSAIKN